MDLHVILFAALVLGIVGVGTVVWSVVGILRSIARRASSWRRSPHFPRIAREQVAVLIAAHNEELVIDKTLASAATQVPPWQIFVVSDASTDATVARARAFGANVVELSPNRGKAGAIVAAVEHFAIARRFTVLVLLDADTVLARDYLATGLPLFDSPGVVAVAGRATSIVDRRPRNLAARVLTGYRERVYIVMQYLMKYGQAATGINVVAIVPGFASMYRTSILDRIDIDAPGLSIEDYNMTFEIHAKRLGRIAFDPSAAIAYTQDPDTLTDYVRQVSRWSLGFWQTVRRHPWQTRPFWLALWAHIVELVSASVLLLVAFPVIVVGAIGSLGLDLGWWADAALQEFVVLLPPHVVALGVLVPDLALTTLAAVAARRPGLLLIGLAFPLVRVLDAFTCLRAIRRAFAHGAGGVWRSPTRRADVPADATA